MTRIESITAAMDMNKDLWIIPLDKITFEILVEELEYRNEWEKLICGAFFKMTSRHNNRCLQLEWCAKIAKAAGLHYVRKGHAAPWKSSNWLTGRKKYIKKVVKEEWGR